MLCIQSPLKRARRLEPPSFASPTVHRRAVIGARHITIHSEYSNRPGNLSIIDPLHRRDECPLQMMLFLVMDISYDCR